MNSVIVRIFLQRADSLCRVRRIKKLAARTGPAHRAGMPQLPGRIDESAHKKAMGTLIADTLACFAATAKPNNVVMQSQLRVFLRESFAYQANAVTA